MRSVAERDACETRDQIGLRCTAKTQAEDTLIVSLLRERGKGRTDP